MVDVVPLCTVWILAESKAVIRLVGGPCTTDAVCAILILRSACTVLTVRHVDLELQLQHRSTCHTSVLYVTKLGVAVGVPIWIVSFHDIVHVTGYKGGTLV
jgi:hypothetical protein